MYITTNKRPGDNNEWNRNKDAVPLCQWFSIYNLYRYHLCIYSAIHLYQHFSISTYFQIPNESILIYLLLLNYIYISTFFPSWRRYKRITPNLFVCIFNKALEGWVVKRKVLKSGLWWKKFGKLQFPYVVQSTVWVSHSNWCRFTIPLCIRTRVLLPLMWLMFVPYFIGTTCHEGGQSHIH